MLFDLLKYLLILSTTGLGPVPNENFLPTIPPLVDVDMAGWQATITSLFIKPFTTTDIRNLNTIQKDGLNEQFFDDAEVRAGGLAKKKGWTLIERRIGLRLRLAIVKVELGLLARILLAQRLLQLQYFLTPRPDQIVLTRWLVRVPHLHFDVDWVSNRVFNIARVDMGIACSIFNF